MLWTHLGRFLMNSQKILYGWPEIVRLPNARKRLNEKKDSYSSLNRTEQQALVQAMEGEQIQVRTWTAGALLPIL